MKLDIVSALYGLEPGGAEISTRILAQELGRLGVDLEVVSTRPAAVGEPCGVVLEPLDRVPYWAILWLGNRVLDRLFKAALIRRWERRRPDVVLIEDHMSLIGAVAAVEELRKRGQNIALAMTQLWEVDTEFFFKYRPWPIAFVLVYRFRKANQLDRRMDFVNGVTAYLRKRVVDRLGVAPERCGIYYTIAIKEGPKLEAPPPARPLILAPGRINPEKGSLFFYEVVRELAARRRDFDALFLGGGPYEKGLRRRIERDGLGDVCSISGSIPYEQFVRKYAEATVVAAPIMYPCGYTRVVLESLYAGKPVITFDQGSMPEIIVDGKTGFRIPPHSVEKFADACERFIDDPALASNMSDDCRQTAIDHADLAVAARGLLDRLERIRAERAG
ncbi:MAG TPA: glycosyltransferase family 4 protein [Verrucomicrobiae bacterium]|nr:glycosyltransferase family 4 protein [Verrucomicrobiae bacterium]